MAVVTQRRRSSRKSPSLSGEQPDWAALVVFGLLVVLAPLAFGAVDRLVQLGLLVLLAAGLALRPPDLAAPSRKRTWFLLAIAAVLVLKEFAPAVLFGSTEWRRTLTTGYDLHLPWTHHPEPGRAVDALLAIAIAGCWLLWVRTLAGWRPNRAALAWILFGSAAVVAVVSLGTRTADPQAIYGLRFTPGWKGFGPFPNRNHTACFLAMGAMIGAGCVTWAASRRRFWLMTAGIGMAAAILGGLLASQSRGGLIAFGAGAVVFMALVLAKLRNRRTLAILGGVSLVVCGLGLACGAPLVARFGSADSAGSNQGRRDIWHDAASMWHDAPLFGHGLETFVSVFPLYQEQVQSDNEIVLHPESSWLLWLAELGAVPVAAGTLALLVFVGRHGRSLFERQHGFYPMASGLAAAAALLAHSVVDVPAHRWGTAGFALAALALAVPRFRRRPGAVAVEGAPPRPPIRFGERRLALVPAAVAGFWLLPFLTDGPVWSPSTLARVVARASGTEATTVPTAQLEQQLACFPLDPTLHELIGLQQLRERHPGWRDHFRLAARLSPGAWALSMAQARACLAVAPGSALSFWQEAVDRSGFRAPELLYTAVTETRALPSAPGVWSSYVGARPALALAYAGMVPPAEGKAFFDLWWSRRAVPVTTVLSESEIEAFYTRTEKWAGPDQIRFWMDRFKARARDDYPRWAGLLHERGEDAEAWALLARWRPDPAWPPASDLPLPQLERRWQQTPENMVNAQALATAYHGQLNGEAERRVLRATALLPGAPEWFSRKAAWLEAGEGRLGEAVAIMLRAGRR